MPEKQAIFKETNFTALYLLEYYLSVMAKDNYVINDQKTAIATGLSLRSVQDNRRLLENNNLFWSKKITGSGMTIYLYCARKEGVYCKKYFDNLFGYDKVRDVYWNHDRKTFKNILATNSLSQKEIRDITDLLDRYHDKCEKSKSMKCNPNW